MPTLNAYSIANKPQTNQSPSASCKCHRHSNQIASSVSTPALFQRTSPKKATLITQVHKFYAPASSSSAARKRSTKPIERSWYQGCRRRAWYCHRKTFFSEDLGVHPRGMEGWRDGCLQAAGLVEVARWRWCGDGGEQQHQSHWTASTSTTRQDGMREDGGKMWRMVG